MQSLSGVGRIPTDVGNTLWGLVSGHKRSDFSGDNGVIVAVDHSLCCHSERKLRVVPPNFFKGTGVLA